MQFYSALLVCVLSAPAAVFAASAPVKLVPLPKQVDFPEVPAIALSQGSVSIVLGDRATDPERYAAEALAKTARRSFDQTWPVVTESAARSKKGVLIVLGQRSTNSLLDGLCREMRIDLSETSPGMDGYVVQMGESAGRQIALVGGSNARGVIYGQDTLSQLIRRGPNGLELVRASIRDWPSIPWRGKPQTSVKEHLDPGVAEWYALSRYNFVDIRNGIYAFRPDAQLPREEIKAALDSVHRLGMIAYGTVDCAVTRAEQDAVIKMFSDMVDLGVDGLWMSFDDHGWGEDPETLAKKVLDFGRRHGMTKHLIALTPPKGSYQVITGDFNRKLAKVPGMEEAMWFFTELPSQKALDEAASIGLKTRVGWWHNWPRSPMGSQTSRNAECDGFLLSGPGRANGKPPYMPVPRLKEGWGEPSYEYLAEAETAALSVMEWGGSAWKHEYTYPVLGWWGWSPASHSWEDTRTRIYGLIFGEGLADSARSFDNAYRKLTHLMAFGGTKDAGELKFPPRLADPSNRPQAAGLVDDMSAALAKLQTVDKARSIVAAERLERFYLDAMRAETDTARACVELDFPEYWWDAHQRSLLAALYAGDDAKAASLTAAARPRVEAEMAPARQRLTEMAGIDRYADWWIKRASAGPDEWRKLLESRKSDHHATLADFTERKIGNVSERLLKGMDNAPGQVRSLQVLYPTDQQDFWGFWTGGFYESGGKKAYCFAYPLHRTAREGEYCEVKLTLPNHGPGVARAVQFFFNTWTNDNVGLQLCPGRWLGRNFLQLKLGDKLLWEGDIGLPRGDGEWVTVSVPPVTDGQGDLVLTLRAETRSVCYNCGTVAFIGPLRVLIPDG